MDLIEYTTDKLMELRNDTETKWYEIMMGQYEQRIWKNLIRYLILKGLDDGLRLKNIRLKILDERTIRNIFDTLYKENIFYDTEMNNKNEKIYGLNL
mgnify:CR=1 FL=1